MELKEMPSVLADALQCIKPIPESLAHIYSGLGDVALGIEERRIREELLDLGAKLVAINRIRNSQ